MLQHMELQVFSQVSFRSIWSRRSPSSPCTTECYCSDSK